MRRAASGVRLHSTRVTAVRVPSLSVLALAVLVAIAGVGVAGATRAAPSASVTVDVDAKRQVIQGFGSSVRIWSDPHLADSPRVSVPAAAQREILTALYRRLGLSRARSVLDPGVQKQAGGPFDFAGKLGDGHAAFVKQARPYGLRTVLPGPVYLEDWMTPGDPGAYVDWAMAMLKRWRQNGLELAFYAPLNEPEVARDFPAEWLRQVVRQLGARMRAAGFETKLVVPDDENPVDAYERAVAVLEDPVARQYVGAVAFHVYRLGGPSDWARLRQLASRYKLPLWMTEYSTKSYTDWRSSMDWAVRMHGLLTTGGVNAIDYLWGFFGDWVRTDTMISIQFDDGAYRGFSATPIYWITGQYSRFVRPGDVRLATTTSGDGTSLVSAYRGRGRTTVVAVNSSDRADTVRIIIRGARTGARASATRSSAGERWRVLPQLRVVRGAFTATLPAESVTTFVVAG